MGGWENSFLLGAPRLAVRVWDALCSTLLVHVGPAVRCWAVIDESQMQFHRLVHQTFVQRHLRRVHCASTCLSSRGARCSLKISDELREQESRARDAGSSDRAAGLSPQEAWPWGPRPFSPRWSGPSFPPAPSCPQRLFSLFRVPRMPLSFLPRPPSPCSHSLPLLSPPVSFPSPLCPLCHSACFNQHLLNDLFSCLWPKLKLCKLSL